VQTVGELDEDDAQVARHRQQHLAEVLRLRLFLRAELDLVELGEAIDQLGGNLAEALGDLRLGDVGVLHHVVEERGDQRLRVEVPVGDQRTHRHRVADIGLAADAELAGVGIGGEVVGRLDAAHVLGPEVGLQLGLELLEVEREHARHRRAEDFGGWACFGGFHATPGRFQAWPRLSISRPTLPASISRSAITVGLSRSSGSTSICGVPPAVSWRAR